MKSVSMRRFQYKSQVNGGCLVASHVTEPGLSLTEPGPVIKFIDISSHTGTHML